MSTTKQETSTRHPESKDAVRAFNKHILNPLMMLVAGRRYWYAAVIHHTGRRSGRPYATPVVADRVEGGFVIPLPYGTGVDWLRNVQAAGAATLQVRGERYEVVKPEIVDAAAVFPRVPAKHARIWRRMGIEHYLELTINT